MKLVDNIKTLPLIVAVSIGFVISFFGYQLKAGQRLTVRPELVEG
jgi:hypothetical protein